MGQDESGMKGGMRRTRSFDDAARDEGFDDNDCRGVLYSTADLH